MCKTHCLSWLVLAWMAAIAAGAASEFDPSAALHELPLTVAAPPTTQPPRIAAAISAEAWTGAAAVTGLFEFSTGRILSGGPTAFLTYDREALYVLVVTPEAPGRALVATQKARDSQVFLDDSVELYLQPPKGGLYQVIVNSIGTMADFRNGDIGWNSHVAVKVGEVPGGTPGPPVGEGKWWQAALRVPFVDLSAEPPKPGDAWKLNVCVNRGGPWASLAPVKGGSFADTKTYPALRFLAADEPYARVTSLGDVRFGKVHVTGEVVNPGPTEVRVACDLDLRKEGSRLSDDAYRNVIGAIKSVGKPLRLAAGARAPLRLDAEVTDTSLDRLALQVAVLDAGGKAGPSLLALHGPVQIQPLLALQVGNVPSRQWLRVSVDSSGLKPKVGDGEVRYAAELLDAVGKVVARQEFAAGAGKTEARISYGGAPVGSYRCRILARSGRGEELAVAETAFRVPAPPVWLMDTTYDRLGEQDRVPLPWSPVRFGDNTARVWGREMRWTAASILPSSIRSRDVELLRRPMQLLLTIGGKDWPVPLNGLRVVERKASRVALRGYGTVQGIAVQADMVVSYDGYLDVHLALSDGGRGVEVQAIRVVAALEPKQTTLYQTFCRRLAGWIGGEPIKMPWLSVPGESTVNFYHWFGDEDKGLGFTYTSLRGWESQSEDNFATLYPGAQEQVYRINLVERPTVVAGRSYDFGIQATPIKPLPPDYHSQVNATLQYDSWRAIQRITPDIDTTLIWPLETGAMPGLNAPYNVKPNLVQDAAKYAHDKSIAFLGVANCPQKVSAQSADFADWVSEWQVEPESVLNWEGVPQVQNCGGSYTLRKWLFYGWALANIKRFGLDGLYTDGWQAGTMACDNADHGCGWTDAQGKRHLTIPVREGREYNHRMLLWLEDNVKSPYVPPRSMPDRPGFPKYQYRIHSWEFVPPVMGLATQWLTGEFAGYPLQGPSMLTPEGTFGKCLGLGLFRARCLSTNWGVPNTFHALMWEASKGCPTDKQTLMAYAWFLPHGVPRGELMYMNQDRVTEIEGILTRFGTRAAEFTPGWRTNRYLAIESPMMREVMVATWRRVSDGRVLAVVSNLQVDKPAEVVLKWKGAGPVKMTDARTGEAVRMEGGRMKVEVGGEGFRLLEVG